MGFTSASQLLKSPTILHVPASPTIDSVALNRTLQVVFLFKYCFVVLIIVDVFIDNFHKTKAKKHIGMIMDCVLL
jgi:hypothetical protein